MQVRTGQKIDFDNFVYRHIPWERERELDNDELLDDLKLPPAFDLPDRGAVDTYFHIYRTSLVRRIFPIIDPILFWDTCTTAYRASPSSSHGNSQTSAKACVLAFAALATRMLGPSSIGLQEIPRIDGEACLIKARNLLPHVLQDSPTLDGLQAATMLVIEFYSINFDVLHQIPNHTL